MNKYRSGYHASANGQDEDVAALSASERDDVAAPFGDQAQSQGSGKDEPRGAPDSRPAEASTVPSRSSARAVPVGSSARSRRRSADGRFELLSVITQALSSHGATAEDLERRVKACAARLGISAEIFAVPTAVIVTWRLGAEIRTEVIRTRSSAIDLEMLARLDQVIRRVAAGEVDSDQALIELRLIMAGKRRFPWFVRALGAGAGAASLAVVLGGGQREALAAAIVGFAVGLLVVAGSRVSSLERLIELLAGVTATALTLGLATVLPRFHLATVILSGLITLLPGLAITNAVAELAARHLVAGSARLAGAAVTLFNLGFGVALAYAVFRHFKAVPPSATAVPLLGNLPTALVVVALAIGLAVTMNAQVRDVFVVLGAVVIAVWGARLGAYAVGPTLGVSVASLLVGLSSNLYARLSDRPAALALAPGIAVLVPGALGFQGMSAFLRHATGSVQTLSSVLVIAVGIVVGLLIADATLPAAPRPPGRETVG